MELQGGITVGNEALTLNGNGTVNLLKTLSASNPSSIPGYGGALRSSGGNNTYGGLITLAAASRISNTASGTLLKLSNTGNLGGNTFTLSVGGAGNTEINSVIATTTGGLIKDGTGTLTLKSNSANTYTGATTVAGGTLLLDFANLSSNLINSSSALNLGGSTVSSGNTGNGTLSLKGNSASDTSQTLGNLTVGIGGGQILIDPNGASRTATLKLGTLTATATGGSLLVGKAAGSSGTAVITTTSGTLTNGIYNGRTVFTSDGGTTVDWATTASVATPFAFSAYSGYTTLPTTTGSSTTNYKMTTGTALGGGVSVNTLKLEGGDLALAGNTLTFAANGGLLATGSTAINVTGTAGGTRLTGATDLIVHQFNTAGLNIGAVIGGSQALTKAGTGSLTLSGVNTFTGATYLNAGTLNLANSLALQSSAVTMNGGTLTFDSTAGTAFTLGGLNAGNTGAGYDVALKNTADQAVTLTLKGGSYLGGLSGAGSVVIAGNTNLVGNQTYTGSTTINSGATLNLGSNRFFTSLSPSSAITNNGSLIFQPAGGITIQGTHFASNITGIGSVQISNETTVVFHGVNSFSGGMTFNANDYLYFDNDGSLGTGTINAASTTNLGSVDATAHTLANALNINGGSLIVGKNAKVYGGTGDLTFTGTVALGTAARTITVTDSTTATLAGKISGALGGITKTGTGNLVLSGANDYTGATAVSQGSLIARSASALGTGTSANVSVTGSGVMNYYATEDAKQLAIGGTLTLTGGSGATIGGSIGSTTSNAKIAVAGTATTSGAIKVNIFGITGVTPAAGTNTYTLVSAASGLNGGTYSAANTMVYNNTDFTVGTPSSATGAELTVAVTKVAAISTAYWKGGLTNATTVWAASNGSTQSNWVTSSGGANQALVPGSGADVIISNSSITTVPNATTLGADMAIKSLTISDTTNGLGLNSDPYALTIGAGGITMSSGVPTSSIAAKVALSASQIWTNNSVNALVVSGVVSGTFGLTKAGTGTLILSGTNTYTGATAVNAGTLLVGNGTNGSLGSTVVTVGGALASGTAHLGWPRHAWRCDDHLSQRRYWCGWHPCSRSTRREFGRRHADIFQQSNLWYRLHLRVGPASRGHHRSRCGGGCVHRNLRQGGGERRFGLGDRWFRRVQDRAWRQCVHRCLLEHEQELDQHLHGHRCPDHAECRILDLQRLGWNFERDLHRPCVRPRTVLL